ncbi:MAG: GLPGLI family protein [Flavisolibacter sp.]
MKKILALCFAFCSLFSFAQTKEGRVVYERVFQLPARMFILDPSLANQIPKSRTDQYELLFSGNHVLWQYIPNATNEGDGNSFAGGGMVFRFGGPGDISFFDLDKGTRVDQREIMDRSFVVTDTIRKQQWKLTDETKTILNHLARKATTQRVSTRTMMTMENGEMKRTPIQDTSAVVAWFTTDIPVSAGPEFSGQLPGLILELDIANGQTVYHALEISPSVNAKKIKEPKDGKKVTADEFTAEREKIMEEMRKNSPAGMNIRIQN